MLEKDFRVQKLRSSLAEKRVSKYAIYGSGNNAEVIFSMDIGENAAFIIDEKKLVNICTVRKSYQCNKL